MSLLLEALKKAELTKQAAKEQIPNTDRPAFTRDKLPDITQALDIRSEDLSLAPGPAPARSAELALEDAGIGDAKPEETPQPMLVQRPSAARAAAAAYSPPASETLEREQAQQFFETKEMDINPRKPFYFTVGALVVFAFCTVAYFWYQMQPKNTYKLPPPSERPAVAAPAAPVPEPAATAPGASTVTPPIGSLPDLPAAPAAPTAAAAPTATTGAPERGRATSPRLRPAAAPMQAPAAPPRRETAAQSNITITPASALPDPVLEGAFQAFNAGDLGTARSNYQQVLRSNPANRDALLGLAAVETRAKRLDSAEAYYARLLELDPRDMHAQAGLIGLKGQIDPLASESRLKNMIASQPEASFLYFALGNQLATQKRWDEAQQAYFKAYAGDPDNPDFAYNLAVSLDQIRQTKPALEYYRRALALAGTRTIAFDKVQVGQRISQLER